MDQLRGDRIALDGGNSHARGLLESAWSRASGIDGESPTYYFDYRIVAVSEYHKTSRRESIGYDLW